MNTIPDRATLKMVRGSATTDANGAGVLLFQVPGTPGGNDGRLIEGGTGWFLQPLDGDHVKIYVTDEDNLLGAGAGYVVDSFTDEDMPAANQGDYISHHSPMLKISPITDGAFIPAGMYVKVIVQKGSAVVDTFRCNIKWGKRL